MKYFCYFDIIIIFINLLIIFVKKSIKPKQSDNFEDKREKEKKSVSIKKKKWIGP